MVFWGLYWGLFVLGNYHLGFRVEEFRDLGFRGLGFRGLGFAGLGSRGLGVVWARALKLQGLWGIYTLYRVFNSLISLQAS